MSGKVQFLGLWIAVFVAVALTACSQNETPPTPVNFADAQKVLPTPTNVPISAEPTHTQSAPLPTHTIPPTDTAPPPVAAGPDLALTAANVVIYPTAELIAGDQATFQVAARLPDTVRPQDVELQIFIDEQLLVNGVLGRRNLAREAIGLYEWVWDTTDAAGLHTIRLTLDPNDTISAGDEDQTNNEILLNVTVAAAQSEPPQWITSRSNNATLHVISGSAAERDLALLSAEVDAAIREASDRLNMFPPVNVDIYFADRVYGNGGYANESIVISYPERNYSGGNLYELLVHETIHILDNEFEPTQPFRFLVEGLAVWGTGGHYKTENLDQLAAALYFETDRYIPLPTLANNFYPSQHEVGYLEAGSFFKFLVDTYSWDRVRQFYGDFQHTETNSVAQTMSLTMQRHFGKTFQQLENDWLVYLRNQPRSSDSVRDLILNIQYRETMRLYQQTHDPSVYFLSAWLPAPEVLRERGLTGELERRPDEEINVWLETMLVSADSAIAAQQYDQAAAFLQSIERVLRFGDVTGDPLATSYLNLIRAARAQGLEVRDIEIDNTIARVQVTDPVSNEIGQLTLALRGQEWVAVD
jgi:hypothetical protein